MTNATSRGGLALATTVGLLAAVGHLCLGNQEAMAQTLGLELRAQAPVEELHQDQPVLFTTVFDNPGPGILSFGLTSLGWRDRPGFVVVPVEENPRHTVNQPPTSTESWEDRYFLGPTFEPNVPVARVDLLRMWAPGDHRFQGRLTDWDGRVYTSNVVELTVAEVPAEHPLRPLLEEAEEEWHDFGFRLVWSYYYGEAYMPRSLLRNAAEALREADDDRQWSAWLEVGAGVDLLDRFGQAAAPRPRRGQQVEDPAEAFRLCEWFEERFPDSPLLPELRLRKALLMAAQGRAAEAREIVHAERERSPIARLLYHNLALTKADPARLLEEPE